MMEQCQVCRNCCEFTETQANKDMCVCGHPKEAHIAFVMPEPIRTDMKNTLLELERCQQEIRSKLSHIERLTDKMKSMMGVE